MSGAVVYRGARCDPGQDVPLAKRLESAGRAQEHVIRGSAFVHRLAARALPWKAYSDWLAQHFFLYESLESARSVMSDDPICAAFAGSAPQRLTALAADLRFLNGTNWERRIVALPATSAYCTRLRDVSLRSASAFVAHHYSRHVDDLPMCRWLAPAVQAAYGLSRSGCRFVASAGVTPASVRARHGELVDGIAWSPSQRHEVVTEAAEAQRWYRAVLDELGRRWT